MPIQHQKTLEQLQKEADAANAALAEAKKQKAEQDKDAFLEKVELAVNAFNKLDSDIQAALLADDEFKLMLAPFGGPKTRKTKGGRYDEAKILAFLADGPKEQPLVQTHCKTSKPSIGNWGKKLVEAGKISIEPNPKKQSQNIWKLKA